MIVFFYCNQSNWKLLALLQEANEIWIRPVNVHPSSLVHLVSKIIDFGKI